MMISTELKEITHRVGELFPVEDVAGFMAVSQFSPLSVLSFEACCYSCLLELCIHDLVLMEDFPQYE